MSGILLAKTMGRSQRARGPLPQRVRRTGGPRGARAHGRALADGHRPDELRDHARGGVLVRRVHDRQRPRSRSRSGTVVAFTTLQTRLLFPMQSLLSVGVEVQTSLALFGRIFEYLDLPDRHRRAPRRPRSRRGARRRAPGRGVVPVRPRTAPWTLRDITAEIPAGTQHGAGRRDRLGQDHARLPGGAPVRAPAGQREHRRRGHPRPQARLARGDRRARLPGDLPVPRLDPREPPLRLPGGDRRARSKTLPGRPRSTS